MNNKLYFQILLHVLSKFAIGIAVLLMGYLTVYLLNSLTYVANIKSYEDFSIVFLGVILLAVVFVSAIFSILNYYLLSRNYIFDNFFNYLGIILAIFSFWIFPLIFNPFFGPSALERYIEFAFENYYFFLIFSVPLYISFFFIKKKNIFWVISILYLIPLYFLRGFVEALGTLG